MHLGPEYPELHDPLVLLLPALLRAQLQSPDQVDSPPLLGLAVLHKGKLLE